MSVATYRRPVERIEIDPPSKSKTVPEIIDVDIHHQTEKVDELFPYLPRQYVERGHVELRRGELHEHRARLLQQDRRADEDHDRARRLMIDAGEERRLARQ